MICRKCRRFPIRRVSLLQMLHTRRAAATYIKQYKYICSFHRVGSCPPCMPLLPARPNVGVPPLPTRTAAVQTTVRAMTVAAADSEDPVLERDLRQLHAAIYQEQRGRYRNGEAGWGLPFSAFVPKARPGNTDWTRKRPGQISSGARNPGCRPSGPSVQGQGDPRPTS